MLYEVITPHNTVFRRYIFRVTEFGQWNLEHGQPQAAVANGGWEEIHRRRADKFRSKQVAGRIIEFTRCADLLESPFAEEG